MEKTDWNGAGTCKYSNKNNQKERFSIVVTPKHCNYFATNYHAKNWASHTDYSEDEKHFLLVEQKLGDVVIWHPELDDSDDEVQHGESHAHFDEVGIGQY